jgi:hypothetical protein
METVTSFEALMRVQMRCKMSLALPTPIVSPIWTLTIALMCLTALPISLLVTCPKIINNMVEGFEVWAEPRFRAPAANGNWPLTASVSWSQA